MIFLTAFIQPVIQSYIARGNNPTQSLAAYGVAWGLISVMVGPLYLLHQISLVYIGKLNDTNWKVIFKFSISIGVIISSFICIGTVTPLGPWLLDEVMSVPKETGIIIRRVMMAFALYPAIRSLREVYWGYLMHVQRTTVIGLFKFLNLLLVMKIMFLVSSINSAVLGALAFTIGEGVETFLIYLYVKLKLNRAIRTVHFF